MTKSETIKSEYQKNKNIRLIDIYNKFGFSKGLISKVLRELKRQDIIKKFNDSDNNKYSI